VVFTLSQWGQLRLQIQQLPHEYLFLQEHLPLMIERRDVHLVGEFVQCLRIFGVEETNSSLLDGLQFLLEEQMADGSWDNACGTQDSSSGNGQGDVSGNDHGNAVDNTHINPTVNTHINPTDNTHNNNTSSTTTQPTLNVDEAYVAYHATMVAIQALIPPLFTGYGCMSESTETIVSQWYQTEV
jgi:chromosome 02 contig 1, DNA sequence